MKILAIESSCDETAAAVVEDGVRILSNVVVSQIDIFAAYGGVIPEVAARSHLEAILPVVQKALDDAGVSWKEGAGALRVPEIDAIAVTHTPGLMGSLLIGTLTARMLAILWGKPLYAVHHLKSHIYSNWLEQGFSKPSDCRTCQPVNSTMNCRIDAGKSGLNLITQPEGLEKTLPCNNPNLLSTPPLEAVKAPLPQFPLLALVISGGHTQIIYMKEHNQFEIIGTTRDDAVGECFDKVAKILGLPYPGGPSVAQCAEGRFAGDGTEVRLRGAEEPDGVKGDPLKYKLPRPKIEGLDFSFSGLKTAVLRAVQAELGLPITTPSYELKEHLTEKQRADFAASFQRTACDILIDRLKSALLERPEARSLVFAGGVSANKVLRERALAADFGGREVYFPEPRLSGDNGAMVGAAAYFEIISGVKPTDPYSLSIAPRTVIK